MGEIRFVGTGETRGYLYLVCKKSLSQTRGHSATLIENSSNIYLCPRDDSQGALRFTPVCPSVCLSVRPFVTLSGIEFV